MKFNLDNFKIRVVILDENLPVYFFPICGIIILQDHFIVFVNDEKFKDIESEGFDMTFDLLFMKELQNARLIEIKYNSEFEAFELNFEY